LLVDVINTLALGLWTSLASDEAATCGENFGTAIQRKTRSTIGITALKDVITSHRSKLGKSRIKKPPGK